MGRGLDKKVNLNTRLTLEDEKYIINIANENEISKSELVRNIIIEFIKNHKQEVKNEKKR